MKSGETAAKSNNVKREGNGDEMPEQAAIERHRMHPKKTPSASRIAGRERVWDEGQVY